MASANMQAYLADKYMSGPKADAILARAAPKRLKKKRKADSAAASGSGAMVVDEDGGWGTALGTEADGDDAADDISQAVVASDRGFKKRRTEESGWATVRGGLREESPPPPADERPLVVEEETPFKGGLLSAAQLKKTFAPKDLAQPTAAEAEAAQETVYRDASGRKIDTKAARAEAARKKREKEEKEAQKMEWGKGLVQREEQAKLKKELELLKTQAFSRHADDKALNEELKAKDRWNDPAAKFLTTTKTKGPRKPQYNGPTPPPNRFNIKPGYRWDGVDRGNGFEKKWFQRGNERSRNKLESYQWGAEDM